MLSLASTASPEMPPSPFLIVTTVPFGNIFLTYPSSAAISKLEAESKAMPQDHPTAVATTVTVKLVRSTFLTL